MCMSVAGFCAAPRRQPSGGRATFLRNERVGSCDASALFPAGLCTGAQGNPPPQLHALSVVTMEEAWTGHSIVSSSLEGTPGQLNVEEGGARVLFWVKGHVWQSAERYYSNYGERQTHLSTSIPHTVDSSSCVTQTESRTQVYTTSKPRQDPEPGSASTPPLDTSR